MALRSAELRGLGGPAVNLVDCAEDHRCGALDCPAHRVPGAVAVMDLGEPPVDRDELAVRAGCHVAARATARFECGVLPSSVALCLSAETDTNSGTRYIG